MLYECNDGAHPPICPLIIECSDAAHVWGYTPDMYTKLIYDTAHALLELNGLRNMDMRHVVFEYGDTEVRLTIRYFDGDGREALGLLDMTAHRCVTMFERVMLDRLAPRIDMQSAVASMDRWKEEAPFRISIHVPDAYTAADARSKRLLLQHIEAGMPAVMKSVGLTEDDHEAWKISIQSHTPTWYNHHSGPLVVYELKAAQLAWRAEWTAIASDASTVERLIAQYRERRPASVREWVERGIVTAVYAYSKDVIPGKMARVARGDRMSTDRNDDIMPPAWGACWSGKDMRTFWDLVWERCQDAIIDVHGNRVALRSVGVEPEHVDDGLRLRLPRCRMSDVMAKLWACYAASDYLSDSDE